MLRLFFLFILAHVVLVVVLCVLEVVMYLVRTCVHLLIVKVDALRDVVVLHVPEDRHRLIIVTVCVITVVIIVLVAEEIATLVVHLDVILMDVILHVLVCVIAHVHKEHYVDLLLVRPQAVNLYIYV